MASRISGKYTPPSEEHPASLRDRLRKEGGPGRAADPMVRDRLSPLLGGGIEQSRLHTGPAAAQAAQGLKASAFTIGRDVFFGAGKYDPHSPQGMGLIAHEATHVGQQTLGSPAKARFNTLRGGDEMEQEAQQTAEMVMRNLGSGESFSVAEYVRRYEGDGEKGVAPSDQQRLDRLSLLALKKAQRDPRLRRLPRQSAVGDLNVDLSVELGENSDEDILDQWSEAIVMAVLRTQRTVAPETVRVQRDPVTNVSLPPTPATTVAVRVRVVMSHPDLKGVGAADVVMGADREAVFQGLRAAGMQNMTVLSVLLGLVKDFKEREAPIADKEATPVGPFETQNPDPTNTNFDEAYATAFRPFMGHARAFEAEWTGFQTQFIQRGSLAVLQLIGEGRKRTEKLIADLGIETTDVNAMVTSTRHTSKSESMAKLSKRAGILAAKQKTLDELLAKKESNYGFVHQLFTSGEAWEKEDQELQAKIKPARENYAQERAAAQAEYPILSHFDTAAKLGELADGSTAAQAMGEKLFEILGNIKDIDDRIGGNHERILDLGDHLPVIKRTLGLSSFEGATVDYMREKRTGDLEAGTRTLQLFAIVVGAIAAAPTGGSSLMVASAALAEAGINTVLLLQELDQYNLQKAAAKSDPDLAQALAKDEPSFFWMALSVVQTLAGLKDNVGQMSKAFGEIKAAYKVAQMTGDSETFAAVLKAKGVPEKEGASFLDRLKKEVVAVAEGIGRNGPEGIASALEMIRNSPNFYGVRMALWRLKAPSEPIIKANLQAARLKAIAEVVEKAKVQAPFYTYTILDGGFEKPVKIKVALVGPVRAPGPPPTLRGFPPPPPTIRAPGGPPPPSVGSGGGPGGGGGPATLPGLGPGVPADFFARYPDAEAVKTLPNGALMSTDFGRQTTLAGGFEAPGGSLTTEVSPNTLRVPELGAGEGSDAKKLDILFVDEAAAPAGTMPSQGNKTPNNAGAPNPAATPNNAGAPAGGGTGGRTPVPTGDLPPGQAHLTPENFPGMFFRIDENRFKLNVERTNRLNAAPDVSRGTSGKVFLYDDAATVEGATKPMYMFKPAGQEAALNEMLMVQQGTYFARGGAVNMIAKELPTVHDDMIPQIVVSWNGQLGSLQRFREGTFNLNELAPDVRARVEAHPNFIRMRQNTEAFDHVVNNPDRNPGNFIVELDKDNNLVSCFSIDPDLSMTAGGRTASHAPFQRVPNMSQLQGLRGNLDRISRSLFDEFQMMKVNEASIRETMIAAGHIDPHQVDGIFQRLDEVLRDFNDRLKRLPESEVFSD